MASFVSNVEHFFKQKSTLSTIIAINIIVFLVLKVVNVFCLLFTVDSHFISYWGELPASLERLLVRPWTLLTYMFTHYGVWHILFNMLWLYWFGKLFLSFFTQKQLNGLYLLGGLIGALCFILAFNLFPYFRNVIDISSLTGASASVMAIVFATAFYKKDYEVNLFLLGPVKLIYIAVVFLLMDILSIQYNNPGGHIAHLGGAVTGIWYAYSIRQGKDITKWINDVISYVSDLFKKKPKKNMKVHYKRPLSDVEYNTRKADNIKEIDQILDKIKASGYDSLSEGEKKTLFNSKDKL